MSPNSIKKNFASDIAETTSHLFSSGGVKSVLAVAALTLKESIRSRVLLGITLLMTATGLCSLLWPGDIDGDRLIFVQRMCLGALVFFGLVASIFLAASSLPHDITSKKIYSLVTKPLTRLELLLGKTFGLMAILFLFVMIGGAITIAASMIADTRRTYEGGSYTIEVTAPTVDIETEHGKVTVKEGQIYTATGFEGGHYSFNISSRDSAVVAKVSEKDVALRARKLEVQRAIAPLPATGIGRGGSKVEDGELQLSANEIAVGDVWRFRVPDLTEVSGDQIPVRLLFDRIKQEPAPTLEPPFNQAKIRLEFINPTTKEKAAREMDFSVTPFTFGELEKAFTVNRYNQVIALPSSLLSSNEVYVKIYEYAPKYGQPGRVFYDITKSPLWRFDRINKNRLPQGRQTLQMKFLVWYQGMDLVDTVDCTAILRNPTTLEEHRVPMTLRNKTTSFIRFPADIIDAEKGFDLIIAGIPQTHRIGHNNNEMPVYLLLTPDNFVASMARSIGLIYLYLSLFVILSVASSTFLSAPVAILLVMMFAMMSAIIDMMMQMSNKPIRPASIFNTASTLQASILEWLNYLLVQVISFFAPGFERFSSTEYINRGWSLPWPVFYEGLSYALVYGIICFISGYLLFRRRELG